eukprot:8585548-Lingulodinium_polyedra.AAC.1
MKGRLSKQQPRRVRGRGLILLRGAGRSPFFPGVSGPPAEVAAVPAPETSESPAAGLSSPSKTD